MSKEEKESFISSQINVQIDNKSQNKDLLCKHYDVFNKVKTNLGKEIFFEHKIDMKEDSPICVTQFPMPEVHKDILESQII
jgi:hypothetical protein